jgi:hypothetical protein
MLGTNLHIGVVEDRNDPEKLGRVRVRILGLHSPDRKSDIQIADLPFATVMQPPNVSTAGPTLSQLVEGTWVIVMFLDQNMQDPLILGSIPSSARSETPNYGEGFSDPFGVFPRWTGDSELSLITDEERFLEHPTYDARGENRITEIPRARKFEMPTVSSTVPDQEYQRSLFDEPDLRGEQDSKYPFNSVREFEAGQVEEYDSTPDNSRITEMHQSGSYREILDDGTTTVKIVGEGYSITLKNHNMYVQGDLNLTVEGNMRQLVQGDYTLEVDGNYHQFVRGNREHKVGSNDLLEIGSDQSVNIASKQSIHTGSNQTILFDGNHIETIGGTSGQTVKGNRTQITTADSSEVVTGNESLLTVGTRLITTEGKHRMESVANIEFDTDNAVNVTAPSNVNVTGDVIADGVSLKTHIHSGVTSGPSNTGQPV